MNRPHYAATALLATLPTLGSAQERSEHAEMRMGPQQPTAPMRMVMPTNNAKVFRLVRPAVGALQVSLAERGEFTGRITGLFGPSTRTALAALQRETGEADTGVPTLGDILALLGLDAASMMAKYGDRIAVGSPPTTGGGDMGGMGAAAATVSGDPAPPKSPMSMEMPGIRMRENDHTVAVRSFREFVAAVQIKLAEVVRYDGPIDGLPGGASLGQALEVYQEGEGLSRSGKLDFPTAVMLFGHEYEAVLQRYEDRIDLEYSPVATDRELLRRGLRRRPPSTSGR